MKKNIPVKPARTHFEQIPLEDVKKIARQVPDKDSTAKAAPKRLALEPPARKTEPYSVPLSALCWAGR